MVIVANPGATGGMVNAPSPPVKSEKIYDLTKDQTIDIEVPAR
jgi:hypothetical protein